MFITAVVVQSRFLSNAVTLAACCRSGVLTFNHFVALSIDASEATPDAGCRELELATV